MRFEPLSTPFPSAGRFPSEQELRTEDSLRSPQKHLASDDRSPLHEGLPSNEHLSSNEEPSNEESSPNTPAFRRGTSQDEDQHLEAAIFSATENKSPLLDASQSPQPSSTNLNTLPKTATGNPQHLLRRAAEPAYLRIRQDCQRASERLLPLLEHLSRHLFDSNLNVNQLKLACGIRDNSIVILFHAEIGQTPKAYISGRRLETAARLLRETDLKIWQISDLVGYSTLGVFSKAFDRWAGLRPQYYRSQKSAPPGGRTPKPQQIFDGEFVERALNGQLSKDESKRLITRLCEIYGLSLSTLKANLEAPHPSSEVSGSAAE